jgi:outer membrane protein assembly factor BamB
MKTILPFLALIGLLFTSALPAQPLFVQSDFPGVAFNILPLEDGAHLVLGSGAPAGDVYNPFLFKVLPNGDYEWYREYGPQGAYNGALGLRDNLERRPDQQGFVLSTVTHHPDSLIGYQHIMLYETDPDGNPVDSFVLDLPELQMQTGLHVIDDGEYLLGGTLSGEHHFREKGIVWRYHMAEDSIIWSHTFHSTDFVYETMISFIENRGDTVLIGGYGPSITGRVSAFLRAMSIDGEEYWAQEYEEDDTFLDAHLLPDGIVVVGGRGRFGIAEGQVMIKKVDYSGEELWTRTHDFPGRAVAYGITGTPDGGMLLCGWATDAGLLLLKTAQDGDIVWSRIVESADGQVINGRGFDISASADRITCVGDRSGALILQTTDDGLLVDNNTVELPAAQPLRVFPNPATSNIVVELPTNTAWENTFTEIYAADGRLVLRQSGEAIRNRIEIGTLPPGFYHLSLRLRDSDRLLGTATFVKK